MNNASGPVVLQKFYTAIIQPTILLLFALAFLVFFWGIFQMVKGADNEEEVKKGKRNLLWGLVGLVIMFGASGVIAIIKGTFQF